MSVALIHSERFADHETPPGHPERRERAEIFDAIAERWRRRGVDVVAPRAATEQELLRVHDGDYIHRLSKTAGRATRLDPDTFTSPDSYDVALLAAGATIGAVEQAMAGSRAAMALVRPPGHHAERGRARGFCLLNNVAIGAAHARTLGANRVAIVDYDVHHGNGTQHIFEADPAVLYASTHQHPYYPGTGAADEVGLGPGRGFTVNVPLAAGAVAGDFRMALEGIILPVLRQFEPDLLMVSAGFDAHASDPLGGMRLASDAFAAMTMELRAVAEQFSRGRIVAVTEGGYDLQALAGSLDLVIETMNGPPGPARWPRSPEWPTSAGESERGRDAVRSARAALGPFWRLE